MVKGLDTFREAMQPYKEHFVIIGGTACDLQLTNTTMRPRATDDIDIIVVVERITEDFVLAFWHFIRLGNYRIEKRTTKQGQSVYALYRFTLQDENLNYPHKIELLSRHSDLLGEPSGFHIEPIPTDEEHQSLSAIIMDDDFYNFTIQHTDDIDGLFVANNKALIALKINAYLNLKHDKESGKQVNTKDIHKHRSDVLKLVAAGAYPEPQPISAKMFDAVQRFLTDMEHQHEALAAALGTTVPVIEEYLRVLQEEIFISE